MSTLPKSALPDHDLTGVELDMLRYAAEGWTNKQIAERQRTTEQTVKNRWWAVLRKIRARNRAQACVIALKRGWIG